MYTAHRPLIIFDSLEGKAVFVNLGGAWMWRPILITFDAVMLAAQWGRSYKARISKGIDGRWTLDALLNSVLDSNDR